MFVRYGVEMKKPAKHKNPGYFARVVKKAAETATIIDRDKRLFIVESKQEADALADLYDSKDMFEEQYQLYYLEDAETTGIFPDYGFLSDGEGHYLYADNAIPFEITAGSTEQITMARFQVEEHLIAVENQDIPLYFVDRNQKQLIEKYAQAYEIEISFF